MTTKHTSSCLKKAADEEPIFVLRAQDITADAFVELWADAQRYIAQQVQHGMTVEMALARCRNKIRAVFAHDDIGGIMPKEGEAYQCAVAMATWPKRKFAD